VRKIINSTYITLDGTVENPHLWPSLGSAATDVSFEIQNDLLQACDALLMGRRTYESFAAAWPTRSGDAVSERINAIPKYVASTTMKDASWHNTTIIREDLLGYIERLKKQPGKDIVQYGLGPVSYAMMEHGLLDEIRLWVSPLILGRNGEKAPHFLECPQTQLQLVNTRSLPNGVTILNYTLGNAKN
jgi:dihydrofolate reductase